MGPVQKALLLAAALGPFATGVSAENATSAPADAAAGNQANGASAIEEIVVTAQKVEQRLIDVPQSVSVVSADLLEQTHSERFDDFFTRVPSASINETQAGNTRLILRGLNTGGVASTVATYVDETPFGSVTSQANGAILTPDLDPEDIERIEVLRGPQGTLYGANSLGGLLKYVTVLPSTDGIHGSAEVSGEDVDHGSTGWSGRGALNVPLGDTLAIRGSGFYRRDPGYIDDPRFGSNINDGRTYGGRISALFIPTDALTLRGTVMLEDLFSNGTNQIDVDPVTLHPTLGPLTQSRIVEQPNDVQYRIYNLTGTYNFGPVKLLSSTSVSTLGETAILDDSGVYTPALAAELGTIGYAQNQAVDTRTVTEEIRLSSAEPGFLDWTIGGFFNHEHSEINQVVNGVDYSTGTPLTAFTDLATVQVPSRYSEYAEFASGTVHLSKMFDLTLGGRYSHNTQTAIETTAGPLAGGDSSFTARSSDGVFTYSVAPSFKPNDETTVYASVSRGYRPGGPNILPPGAPADVPTTFRSDTTTNYEVGIKSELLDRKLALELTAFDIDWHNIQLIAQIDDYGVDINGSSARSDGVEFSITGHPIGGLVLSANGAYIDARLTQDAPIVVGGLKGDQLPYTARFSSTLGAEYEQPLTNAVSGVAGLSWRYTGARQSAFDPVYGQRELGSYSQLDAHAGVTFGQVRVDAFGRNLTDSRGILDVGGAGSADNGAVAAAVTRPRSFGLTLGYRY
jgi:iron complex outermembrane recepter protein